MPKIVFLPLERLEQRYTDMMYVALAPHVDEIIYPEVNVGNFDARHFLSPVGSSIFKLKQMELALRALESGVIKDGDGILVGDIFYPGLEALLYAAELKGIRLKLFAFNYAGRADPDDMTQVLGKWSDLAEHSWHKMCDTVFVGSQYHAKLIQRKDFTGAQIMVSGLVWDSKYCLSRVPTQEVKEDYLIWPHRIAPEKGVDLLHRFAMRYNGLIVVASGGKPVDHAVFGCKNIIPRFNLSKKEYYFLLSLARGFISTAYQETFGYALQEAMLYGAGIAVPNRACYPEMVPKENLYDSLEELLSLSKWPPKVPYANAYDGNAKRICDYIRTRL